MVGKVVTLWLNISFVPTLIALTKITMSLYLRVADNFGMNIGNWPRIISEDHVVAMWFWVGMPTIPASRIIDAFAYTSCQ